LANWRGIEKIAQKTQVTHKNARYVKFMRVGRNSPNLNFAKFYFSRLLEQFAKFFARQISLLYLWACSCICCLCRSFQTPWNFKETVSCT